jgi:ribosomal protein S27E
MTMKNTVFWDVTPCGSCKNRQTISLPVELSIKCEVGSGQDMAKKSQDVILELTS